MKRKDLITFVERNLRAFGFKQGQWIWQPRSSQLVVLAGGALKTVNLKASMSKKALIFEMGRLAGLCEALGMIRDRDEIQTERLANQPRANGHARDGFGDLASVAAMAA